MSEGTQNWLAGAMLVFILIIAPMFLLWLHDQEEPPLQQEVVATATAAE